MRRVRGDLAVAAALPVVCVLALALTRPDAGDPGRDQVRPADTVAPTTARLACPPAVGRGRDGAAILAAAAPGASGEFRAGSTDDSVVLPAGRTVPLPAPPGPVVVTAAGPVAAGLVATRTSTRPLAAVECRGDVAEQWFAGLGSGPGHSSVIDLVNPTQGPAVVDIALLTQTGPVEVPDLLGVAVPGGGTRSLDLARIAPRRGELSASVRVSRGRLAVSVRDTVDALAGGVRATDWLAPQSAPAARSVLLGLARGPGDRTLVLANPGDDEVQVSLRLMTPKATFVPADLDPPAIVVAAGTTRPLRLGPLLARETRRGTFGLVVEASGPVVASVRQEVAGDVSTLTALTPVTSPTSAIVPAGTARLVVADPDTAGSVTILALDEDGTEVATETVEVVPGAGASVPLPPGAVLVRLTPRGTTVSAALLVVDRRAGNAVVPLRDPPPDDLLPDVRAGLP